MEKQKKFYAVKHGKVDHVVVKTWSECKELTDGVPGRTFKSFLTEEEAYAWLEESDAEATDLQARYKENTIYVFADGACSGNPGPGGWGTIVKYNGQAAEFSGRNEYTTNNAMELEGVLCGLKFAVENSDCNSRIVVVSDSSYVVNGMKGWIKDWKENGWRKKNGGDVQNLELWKELDRVTNLGVPVEFQWVKGHAGHPENERCDKLAVQQAKSFCFKEEKSNKMFTNFDLFRTLDINTLHHLLTSTKFKNYLFQKDALSIFQMLNSEATDWGVEEIKEKLDTK